MINKKLTVTIGIPAHNEEKNIANLLDSLLVQDTTSFDLKEIVIASDGCTDKTNEIVKKYINKNPKIALIDDGKRLGQAGRLNEFYKLNKSEIFVTFDADSVLANNKVLANLVSCFENERVGIASGLDVPFYPQTFFERIVTSWLKAWYYTRKGLNAGNSIHNNHGVVSAVRKEAVQNFEIPSNVKANDDFLFLSIIKKEYEFCFAEEARVFYRAPNNLNDYLNQHGRMYTLKNKIFEHFGDWAKEFYKVPTKNKVEGLLKAFKEDGIYLVLSLALQISLRFISRFHVEKYTSGGISWTPAESTKESPKILKGAF
jgi:cellulose synthase/poly-beta-1,6-N-acetylglucosamine synthase-like glycosyltransferase